MKEHILNKKKLSKKLKKRLEQAEEDIKNGDYKTYSSVKEMMEDIMNRPNPWYKRIYRRLYWFYDDWVSPVTWYYRIERYYLWLFKWGFNPKDLWSLDIATAQFLVPRLKKLKEIKSGTPSMVFDDEELIAAYESEHGSLERDEDYSEKLWDFVLDKMIKGFQLTIDDDWSTSGGYIEHHNKIQECLQYFAKYFNCLWD